MLTLTVMATILSVALAIRIGYDVAHAVGDKFKSPTFMYEVGHMIIGVTVGVFVVCSIGLGMAIEWDVHGTQPGQLRIACFAALCGLGLTSTTALFIRWIRHPADCYLPKSTMNYVKIVFEVLGLISSLLGILSFYLQHLYK